MQQDTAVRQGLGCHLNQREVSLHYSTSIQNRVAIFSSEGLSHLPMKLTCPAPEMAAMLQKSM